MSRYIMPFITPYNPQQVQEYINSYMQNEGFTYVTKNGESYWKKGMGIMTAPQFVKITPDNGRYILEAWIKLALLPGVYVGEMGVKGFVGAVPKSMLKSRVDNILMGLNASVPQAHNPNQ